MGKTRVQFNVNENFWEVVDEWAFQSDLELAKATPSGNMRLYFKNIMAATLNIEIAQTSNQVVLQGWIKPLGGGPQDLKSGLLPTISIPRRDGRKIFNTLLARLGQKPV